MRSILIGVGCLVVGVIGALGYSHFLGEGKQLADLQSELVTDKASLAKANDDAKQAKSETDAMSAQIQQLTATRDDLKKQLETAQSSAPATPAAPANPFASMFSASNMSGIVKAQTAQKHKERLQMLISRLHLTPDQQAAVEAAMDAEDKRTEEMTDKMFTTGKIDPQAMKDAAAQAGTVKSVDQVLQDIMTPDQKTAYQQMQTDQKNSNAEMMASMKMNQMSTQLQLSDTQKDQVETALYQAQLDTGDPAWVKAHVDPSNPTGILDAQAKANEDALAKVLTPDQLATYRQQEQAQLDMQKTMMQKFMPATANRGTSVITVTTETAPAVTPPAPPATSTQPAAPSAP